ncbi:nSTAND1 domain-containing NTPase [Streptomyces luteolus]|uniref:Trypsin-like peptidase domain-containing protein n=1 Tax=Streptomyces luteolus TaxID=3043615 RepID=A0ABT6SSX3_9ACTN|nr:trypsin-like peptidase domain-containing protein [Streptomyces sp. B-S-A12]MDI3418714.1 trypsin-like peptidase domain-containing protein [Streptomyces sp. B-S-A12]
MEPPRGRQVTSAGEADSAWQRGTARVLLDGRPVGVAFLIPDRLLLTCAHVVASTAGLPEDEPLPDLLPVTLDFPLLPGRPEVAARVHFSVPVAGDSSGDVAVLQLSGEPPPGAEPLRIVEAEDLAGHRWRAFGFPKYQGRGGSKDAGIWTRGVVEGREGTGWWQLTCDEDVPFPLAGGFSGAPVWDETYGGVIGVVVAVEGDQRRRTGYALTVDSLTREWPHLRRRLLADSPYRELLPFTEHDLSVFHGRTNETQQLIELFEQQQVPVLTVLGPSGAGKSSLVGAGLIGNLDSDRYLIARLPIGLRLTAEELLAWALASAGDADTMQTGWHDRWSELARQLTDEQGIRTAVERTLARQGGQSRLVLVADQFETLLADAPDTALRLDAMLGVLTARRTDGSRPAQAVVVARIDFLQQIEQLPHLRTAWDTSPVVVQPMTRAQLREVITGPLEGRAGVRFADGLVEQLLRDTPPGPAALPMLEYALSRLWERQERGWLTSTAYQEIGGVEGALAGEAERRLWAWADATEQRRLERIFIQLVRPGEQLDAGEPGPDTRRVAARAQFDADDWALIHRLAGTRLVVVTRRPTERDTAELAHQAIVEKWPRLQRWVEENREFRGWQEGLRRSLRTWQEQGRPRKPALGREQITEARRWIRTRGTEIPADEAEFVSASAQVRRRRQLALVGLGLLTAIVLIAAALVALDARSRGSEQQALAATRSLTDQSRQQAITDPALAARLALAAHAITPTPQARARLVAAASSPQRGVLTGHGAEVRSVSFSPDGETPATSGRDGTARLWDMAGSRRATALDGHGDQVQSAAFSPDGRTLVTSHDGGKVRLWDARKRKPTAVLEGAGGPVAVSPDGTTIVTGGPQGTAVLWDARTHRKTGELRLHRDEKNVALHDVALSPDGTTLAVTVYGAGVDKSDQSEVQLWDVRKKRRTATLKGHTGQVNSLAFSPDGATLATGASDATTRLWDMRTKRSADPLTGQRGTVFALAFSPDGRTLATAGDARTVWLWDAQARVALTVLNGHTELVSALAFSPRGTTLASGAKDGTVRLWDMRAGRPRGVIERPAGSEPRAKATVPPVDYRPDGKVLAVGDNYGGVRLYDVRTRALLVRLTGLDGMVSSVRFSPDGRTIAASSNESPKVLLWDARSHRRLATLDRHTRPVYAVRFSPDGKTLATSSYIDDTTRLWNVRTHEHLASLDGGSSWADFSPDGRTLVTGSFQSSDVRLWDARTHRRLGTIDAVSKTVSSVAFSPDGSTLATAGWDGELRLWDVQRRRLTAEIAGHTDFAQSVTFSPDGKTLASSGRDATARLWDVRSHRRIATLTGHTGPVWSAVVSPDGKTLATTSDDRTVRLWDMETHQQLAMLTGHTTVVHAAVFSPDGNSLATNGSDQTVRLWDTSAFNDLPTLVDRVCAIAGRSLTEQEWRRYVSEGVAYRRICS